MRLSDLNPADISMAPPTAGAAAGLRLSDMAPEEVSTEPPPTSLSDLNPAEIQTAPPEQPPEETPGILSALGKGAMSGFRSIADSARQTFDRKLGEAPGAASPTPADETALAAPLDFPSMPDKNTPAKVAYKLGAMTGGLPEMAGGAAGYVMGGPVGAGLGAGATYAFRQLAPNFAAELHATPDDPDAAWERALKKTTIGGLTTTAAFAAFGLNPFEGELKNLAFQAFGLQPAIALTEKGAENKMEGKPVTEGMGSAYAESALSTVGPYAAMRPFHGKGKTENGPAGEAPPAEENTAPEQPQPQPAAAPRARKEPKPDANNEFVSPVPDFIKGAETPPEETVAPGADQEKPANTFKIEDPAAYGLDLKDLTPEHAVTAVKAAEDTEGAAADLRAALADPALADPAHAAEHTIPQFGKETVREDENAAPAQPAQRGDEGRVEPAPVAGSEGKGAEPGEHGEEGNGPRPVAEPELRGPGSEEAQGQPAEGRGGADTIRPEQGGDRGSEPEKPSSQGAGDSQASLTVGDLDPAARQKFRAGVSKATGQKGVRVYAHGEGAAYDPLAGYLTVGHDLPADKATTKAASDLARQGTPTGWREAVVKATHEDGTSIEQRAGDAADSISSKIKRAMSVLECMG